MSRISTHVLDTAIGAPASGVPVRLFHEDGEIASTLTNSDGRCPSLLPVDHPLRTGTYRIVFDTGAYFPNGFYPEVSISFVIRDANANYHVPLLISPYGFTTYRGS